MIAGSIALSYEQDNPSIRIMDDSAEVVELEIGSHVEVRDRYQGTWSRGFEISAIEENGYRIKRISDGAILPGIFSTDEVRPSRRRQGMWWY
jgi:hypothetical protein